MRSACGTYRRWCAPLVAAALLALVVPASAAATPTIHIRLVGEQLKFVAPKTIVDGEALRVVNETDPRKAGSHTFSLVEKAALPKTGKAQENCFIPGHICKAISRWHGFDARSDEITINPVRVGPAGWSTLGSTKTTGDSWFTNIKGRSISQRVAVDTSAGPSRLYFLDAVHPWAQGSILVLPAG